jgi:hypothetical protein
MSQSKNVGCMRGYCRTLFVCQTISRRGRRRSQGAHEYPQVTGQPLKNMDKALLTELTAFGSIQQLWRYRLGARTGDSQSSNQGSIPCSATKTSLLHIPTYH